MLKWINNFRYADRQTQYYYLNWIMYGLIIFASTLYCYARLDFVRSYPTETVEKAHKPPIYIE